MHKFYTNPVRLAYGRFYVAGAPRAQRKNIMQALVRRANAVCRPNTRVCVLGVGLRKMRFDPFYRRYATTSYERERLQAADLMFVDDADSFAADVLRRLVHVGKAKFFFFDSSSSARAWATLDAGGELIEFV